MVALMAAPCFAGGWVKVGDQTGVATGNQFSGFSSENQAMTKKQGWGFVGATTGTIGYAQSDGLVSAPNGGFAGSTGIGVVHSDAAAGALLFGKAMYNLKVAGSAYGGSAAVSVLGTDPDPNDNFYGPRQTVAGGSSFGSANYSGEKSGKFCFIGADVLQGNAIGVSGTAAYTARGRIGDTEAYSLAGAVTGSMSGAQVGGEGETQALGAGSVFHQTFAEPKVGTSWAATSGEAHYSYNNNGGNCVIGGGFAATGGYSTVSQTENTASAHTRSVGVAFSTGGNLPANLKK